MSAKMVYLDYAAATPIDKRVLEAMLPYQSDQFFNPSATYAAARRVRRAIEKAREAVAFQLGARSAEIIFTAGGTEANNLAIQGVMRLYPDKKVIVSAIEHESVLAVAHQYSCLEVPVHPDGEIDTKVLSEMIDDETVLVSIMYANNEVGTIQPLREIAAVIKRARLKRRQNGSNLPIYFHSDAAQAAGNLDLHVSRLGLDAMTLNGGKIYGPKQSGILWLRSGINLESLLQGGGQERNLRSGTENTPGIIGFSVALDIAEQLKEQESDRLKRLQKLFFDRLKSKISEVIINGSINKRLPSNINISIPGSDNERILLQLEAAGILAASGSACNASNQTPSHVLRAMGIADDLARATIRFTMGRDTTADNVIYTVDKLSQLIA